MQTIEANQTCQSVSEYELFHLLAEMRMISFVFAFVVRLVSIEKAFRMIQIC